MQSVVNELLADLCAKSDCEKIGLTRESFAARCTEKANRMLGDQAEPLLAALALGHVLGEHHVGGQVVKSVLRAGQVA